MLQVAIVVIQDGLQFAILHLIVASPFVVLILAWSHWFFVSGRMGHRVPASRRGHRFKRSLFWFRVRFKR